MKKGRLIALLGIVILVAVYSIAKPQAAKQSIPQTTPKATVTPIAPKVFNLVIHNQKIAQGSPTIQVSQGDTVIITITADKEDELHLHGYDKHVDLEKNNPVKLSFVATIAGRFPFELENAKVELGAVEVQPK